MRRPVVLWLFLLLMLPAAAQHHKVCGTVEYQRQQLRQHPEIKARRDSLEAFTTAFTAGFSASAKTSVTIPVVVHVLWSLPVHNISDAQIISQLAVLNEDYNRQNADTGLTPALFKPVAASCDIHFCLAKRDPWGNPTTGITRTQTNKAVFDMTTDDAKYTAQGGHDVWDPSRYLNIWVVPAITDGNVSNIIGYATYPGGPASTDGVVIRYLNFGRTGTLDPYFDKGRTCTHETGHWLNLIHIWGDDGGTCSGSDLVNDTPNQADENYDCPTFPSPSCGNTSDMYSNYMDYTDDDCMNIFTLGQKARMWAAINGYRASIKTSDGCIPVGMKENDNPVAALFPNPAHHRLTIQWSRPANGEIEIFTITGQKVLTAKQTESTHTILDVSSLPPGSYILRIVSDNILTFKKLQIL